MAEREVRDLIRPQEPKRVKIEDIQRVVARQYNVSRSDLLSSRRTANVVRPRQVAMYLAKTLTLRSLPEIGRRFGGRDHTTVLHAVRKIEALVARTRRCPDEVEFAEAPASGVSRRAAKAPQFAVKNSPGQSAGTRGAAVQACTGRPSAPPCDPPAGLSEIGHRALRASPRRAFRAARHFLSRQNSDRADW